MTCVVAGRAKTLAIGRDESYNRRSLGQCCLLSLATRHRAAGTEESLMPAHARKDLVREGEKRADSPQSEFALLVHGPLEGADGPTL